MISFSLLCLKNYIYWMIVIKIGTTTMNNTVLITTMSVAYFTSPCTSFAKIGKTANAGVAACTINVSLIKLTM